MFSKLVTLVLIMALSTIEATTAGILRSAPVEKKWLKWEQDAHASDPCNTASRPDCVNHIKEGYNVVPMTITTDMNVVMQEGKRPANMAAIVRLNILTQPGCFVSACTMTTKFWIFPKEDCFKEVVEKRPNQPDGQSALIEFGGIYYENLPSGELYLKLERKNELTKQKTCTYTIRDGFKRWF